MSSVYIEGGGKNGGKREREEGGEEEWKIWTSEKIKEIDNSKAMAGTVCDWGGRK